ncbi:MAG: hypothetical protein DRN96_02975 [Thermoproteota archaeon]|nr:MAG: hypothetical protein DRN96_02975 [Candidatus Korarchaeota archaeon]
MLRQVEWRKLLLGASAIAAAIVALTLYHYHPVTLHNAGFSGEMAYKHVLAQCSIGPRVPGSREHEKCIKYIVEVLEQYGYVVRFQNGSHVDIRGNRVPIVNIEAVTGQLGGKILILGAHYDTRPRADYDPDPSKRNHPILGANDGASGVAVLLELARALRGYDLAIELRIVFFDAEDWGEPGVLRDYFLGSKLYASSLSEEELERTIGMILVDMVGDCNLTVYMEGLSVEAAPRLVDLIWQIAQELGYSSYFRPVVGYTVYDDHWPFIRRGIKAVDIIDFKYPYWHTTQDTPDKVCPESLEVTGRVLLETVLNISKMYG